MEAREGISSGVTVIGAEAPSAYHMAPRSEAPNQGPIPEAAAPAIGVSPVSVGLDGTSVKKKRGRPRKYGPDGSVTMALSPMPISSSAPFGNDFSISSGKRGKPRGMEYKMPKKVGVDHLGDSVGTNFMPHIITVNTGEDITMKVISFSQQGPRAICILSANGVISNVTLRQPDSSGGTLTYEGRFEILSLSGSFMPTDNQGTRSRSGGMSVSLSSPDGRVVGGGVAGLLVAASPVQVVVGSFLPSNQQDQKPKKPKSDYAPPATVTPAVAVSSVPPPTTNGEKEDIMGGHLLQNSTTLNSNLTPPSAFRRDNWVNMHSMPDAMKSATDINISLPDS
ncbi:AT-hook motif nuclear-localized protein 7-like [Abrus precatorius]|uniref:AT-hook motif nuclear-localized protein n=1 Tax=Abrus precatorius TaxID=3816 RepID=A0A8B8JQW5_ABRPR|nr:AT-hook motif nuclear-localized protein 7-like [Abrus precatorius]XP_027333681.1 AT-hook motif nuclear-localized protein 7-like [Abrus precatorius]XP_027333689.1 AT-hook motif nuclear-localized protein 7-like [Abrus precatorius]XP_027333696.1 AT-hook motif nuclear-localized protein 7-like [Abrus precatorius]XP_027333704.1 AT-hook motif nuclear-localized protein 7-like [Abrus precatorius]XP_027333713.1 AT-hook motif nuclear-localized protein 7-like [Abrus precatorius]XP_027333723.1 AT-hook 